MSNQSQQLYDEFLGHYNLDTGLYNHAIEMMDHPFEKIEKVQAIRVGETLVPMTPAIKNSTAFNTQLHLASITAEKEVKKHIGMYKGCILDAEDANLFCYTVEELVLRPLLFPFHLLTVEAELSEKDFFPLANIMEGIVCDTQEAIFAFLQGVLGSNDRIDAKTDRKIAEQNRQTDEWAANAPVEVWGSIRRNGKYLDVYASARSTVTSGMVNADYQVNSLLANQSANREKATDQKGLLSSLESTLLNIIGSYTNQWKECLKGLGTIIGRNILRDTLITTNATARPDKKENMIEIIDNAEGDISYANVKRLLDYYSHDYDDLFGESTARDVLHSLIKTKKIDTEDFYYDFYAYFYNVPNPFMREEFFNHFRKASKNLTVKVCNSSREQFPDFFKAENCDKVLSHLSEMIEVNPYLTEKQKNRLSDDNCEVFYDMLGDAEKAKFYRDGAPRFEY